jgi:SAM-dependent methyltransferase
VFAPATLGSVVWLAQNPEVVADIRAGIVLSGVGDAGAATYKRSRRGDALIDRAVTHALAARAVDHEIRDFDPLGYDERQFCSPGFDLPIGCLMRTPPDEYPEYHTSADNLSFIRPWALGDSWATCVEAAEILEHDRVYASRAPFGEPRLGPRGLYVAHGDPAHRAAEQRAILWTLNLADGRHSLLDTAERAGLSFRDVRRAAERLVSHDLLVADAAAEGAGEAVASDRPGEAGARPSRPAVPSPGGCLGCGAPLSSVVVDLGTSPLCESYIPPASYWRAEAVFPLRLYRCERCFLVQLPPLVGGEEIFRHYAYFSAYSDSWVAHARELVERSIDRFGLDRSSLAVEVASNDGYLLQHFVARGVPVLGIDPAANVAEAAWKRGVPTRVEFFDRAAAERIAAEGVRADFAVAINVIGHVPRLNEFVAGFPVILSKRGVLVVEIPSFLETMRGNQFDQIYQEHYCYYTFHTLRDLLEKHGLIVFDVEELATHGGSLRVYAHRADGAGRPISDAVAGLLAREAAGGAFDPATYDRFAARVAETKRRLLAFLIAARGEGKRVAAYGAPGKGNTLLNYCGIGGDMIEFTVDRNPFKQGTFLPGTRIPVYPLEHLAETRPDVVVILPWNLADEIVEQLAPVRAWGGRLVLPIPEPRIVA